MVSSLIDFVIETQLCESPGNLVKRGVLQDFIADRIRIEISPDLRALINTRMEMAGFDLKTLHGYSYYKHVKIR